MTEFLNRIFGRDVQQTILTYINDMKSKGSTFAKGVKFTGKMVNPGQTVFGFSKSEVTVKMALKYEVEGNDHLYITDAKVTPEVPWFKKYFFFCDEGNKFAFPSFPSVAELKAKWCKKSETYPGVGEWCQTDARVWDDYFLYGEPYPESLQKCSVVRSMQIYNFHFVPDSDGIDVEGDVRYDLRFKILGRFIHADNDGNIKMGFDVSKYFIGGLMLGGAYEDFKKFLAKTKANMDCTPALEGLFQAMMAPKLATR